MEVSKEAKEGGREGGKEGDWKGEGFLPFPVPVLPLKKE
jgi:hypothetical protein